MRGHFAYKSQIQLIGNFKSGFNSGYCIVLGAPSDKAKLLSKLKDYEGMLRHFIPNELIECVLESSAKKSLKCRFGICSKFYVLKMLRTSLRNCRNVRGV